MAYTNNMDYRSDSHPRMSARLKQVLVLVTTIVIGMLVSVLVTV
jgi:hypothetical protein